MPMSDKEQLQLVKSWWSEYGRHLLFTLVIFVIAGFGWRYWRGRTHVMEVQASITYTQMINSADQKKIDESQAFGESLLIDYPKSAYAGMAALALAKQAVLDNKLDLAYDKLSFIIKNVSNKSLRQIARIRAARILLALNKHQESLDVLKIVDDKDYNSEVIEAKGDVLLAMGKLDEAKKAYAETNNDKSAKLRSVLLKLKMQQF